MNHVMIDLETLAKTPDATILTFAAVKFNPLTDEVDSNVFYEQLSREDQRREDDPDTLKWWSEQSETAQAEVFGGQRDLFEVLIEFTAWLGEECIPWAQGAAFDTPIIEHAFRQFGLDAPWDYGNVRDTRTLYYAARVVAKNLFEEFRPDDASAHISWRDAYAQCRSVQRALKVIR